jgi:rare lipoprotein A
MKRIRQSVAHALIVAVIGTGAGQVLAAPDKAVEKKSKTLAAKPKLDRSGKPQTGEASFYGRKFYGKKMADGTPMDPKSNVAASKTLPLGTTARVTNLDNGKSAIVEIRDRGPFVAGRIVDVSPTTADKLDMRDDGVAPVRVTPIDIPDADSKRKQSSSAS